MLSIFRYRKVDNNVDARLEAPEKKGTTNMDHHDDTTLPPKRRRNKERDRNSDPRLVEALTRISLPSPRRPSQGGLNHETGRRKVRTDLQGKRLNRMALRHTHPTTTEHRRHAQR